MNQARKLAFGSERVLGETIGWRVLSGRWQKPSLFSGGQGVVRKGC